MDSDGNVRFGQKISANLGNFGGGLLAGDAFGTSVASMGDVDGDGRFDLAVGAPLRDLGGPDRGAVFILRLNSSGAVKSHVEIGSEEGGFIGVISDGDRFGQSVAGLGDTNQDGVLDLAVGRRGTTTAARIAAPFGTCD